MNSGFVVFHRKILDWEWYSDPVVRGVFMHLILVANHEANNWHGIKIQRGQVLTGRKILAKTLGFSEQQIRTSLTKLKSTNDITMESTKLYSIITVCNYSKYQSKKSNDQPSKQPSPQPTINQVSTTNNNDNNVTSKRERVIKKRSSKKELEGVSKQPSEKQTEEILSRLPADVNRDIYLVALKKSFAAVKKPTNVPTYLLDYDDNELLPLCVEMSLDNHDMRTFAREIYEKYKTGVRIKSGEPIKNFKTFFMNIVRADIERLHRRFKKLEWSL